MTNGNKITNENTRVFVIQRQQRFDHTQGKLVDRFDFEKAKVYGEMIYLLSPTAAPFNTTSILPELREKLQDITQHDLILMTGNPILMGLATAVAAEYSSQLTFLQWAGKHANYIPVQVDMDVGFNN